MKLSEYLVVEQLNVLQSRRSICFSMQMWQLPSFFGIKTKKNDHTNFMTDKNVIYNSISKNTNSSLYDSVWLAAIKMFFFKKTNDSSRERRHTHNAHEVCLFERSNLRANYVVFHSYGKFLFGSFFFGVQKHFITNKQKRFNASSFHTEEKQMNKTKNAAEHWDEFG